MSAGAMVAGGLAFTIPGIWMLNPDADVNLGRPSGSDFGRSGFRSYIYGIVQKIFYRD